MSGAEIRRMTKLLISNNYTLDTSFQFSHEHSFRQEKSSYSLVKTESDRFDLGTKDTECEDKILY